MLVGSIFNLIVFTTSIPSLCNFITLFGLFVIKLIHKIQFFNIATATSYDLSSSLKPNVKFASTVSKPSSSLYALILFVDQYPFLLEP